MKKFEGQNVDMEMDFLSDSEVVSYVRPRGVEPLEIKKSSAELLLVYSPRNGAKFVDEKIRDEEECRVASSCFVFKREDVKDLDSMNIGSRTFVLGRSDAEHAGYYRVLGRTLDIPHDVYIHVNAQVESHWFTPYDNTSSSRMSVFKKVSRLIDEDIFIGGEVENAIPCDYWEKVLKTFPTKTELLHYFESRAEALLKEYLPTIKNGERLLARHIENKKSASPVAQVDTHWIELAQGELAKYKCLYALMTNLLADPHAHECDWEKLIVRVICLLYPRYVCARRQVEIHERLTRPDTRTLRRIDIALFDVDGHIDVIEIKKPSLDGVFRPSQDHDNNIPSVSLAKTIMQVEKYVLYLQKGGYELEKELNDKYKDVVPGGTRIKVVNPRGLVVFGRSKDMSSDQLLDLEVIRRKYAHVADIMTYDDLLRRIENQLNCLSTGSGALSGFE